MKEGEFRNGVYVTHRAALIDYATPILGSREAAEDIVQDAFLKFPPDRIDWSSSEYAIGYLYRIVRNLAFDVLKRRKVAAREEKGASRFWAGPRSEATPEEHVLLCDQLQCVARVLSQLPIESRIAVEMHRFGGYTLEEVAEHLSISVATAHRYVRTAMIRIANELDARNA